MRTLNASRRSIFAFVPAVLLGLTATARARPPIDVPARLLASRNNLADWINAEPDWGLEREPERTRVHERIWALEHQLMAAPPSPAAVRAKMQLVLKHDSEGLHPSPDDAIRIMREALAVWPENGAARRAEA